MDQTGNSHLGFLACGQILEEAPHVARLLLFLEMLRHLGFLNVFRDEPPHVTGLDGPLLLDGSERSAFLALKKKEFVSFLFLPPVVVVKKASLSLCS